MSVEASAATGEIWARLEGRVINGAFPLHRYLGSSDHSAVFLTDFAKRGLPEVALKLIPTTQIIPDSYLARWRVAGGLGHPHLLRLLEAGRCQLDGLQYLYLVMEYSDQTLAQLLERRALTEDEVREMLPPVLGTLAVLHERNLVQGRLTPANILVVGDRLKLASDTIRAVGELSERIGGLSAHEPPEARDGANSPAGDIWALGVTLCEALSRQQPSGLDEAGGGFSLPPEISPAFLELVARCLSRAPGDRPTVANIEAWLRGVDLPPAPVVAPEPETIASPPPAVAQEIAAPLRAPIPPTLQGAAHEAAPSNEVASRTEVAAPEVAALPTESVARNEAVTRNEAVARNEPMARNGAVSQPAAAEPVPSASRVAPGARTLPQLPFDRRTTLLILGAVVVFLLTWAGVRAFGSKPLPAAPVAAVPASSTSALSSAPGAAPTTAVREAPSLPAASAAKAKSANPDVASLPSEVHQVIPDVPRSARQTIRGHIRVSVRVIVEQDGTVFAALTEVRGPSRYFERLALDAAKKWTFAPMNAEGQRLMLLRFDFTRQGATASVSALK